MSLGACRQRRPAGSGFVCRTHQPFPNCTLEPAPACRRSMPRAVEVQLYPNLAERGKLGGRPKRELSRGGKLVWRDDLKAADEAGTAGHVAAHSGSCWKWGGFAPFMSSSAIGRTAWRFSPGRLW